MVQRALLGFLLCGGAFLWGAGGHDISQTDIVLRVVNFVLFVALVWYFISGSLKRMLEQRRAKIASKLSALQEQRQTIKEEKERALKTLERAKQEANQIISGAKQEAFLLEQRYEQQAKNVIEKLIKDNQNTRDKEMLKIQQEVVAELLDTLFKTEQAGFDASTYVHLLQDKVAG
ncbi:F0F1 ATP synthase subunit B family protein [Helicobacter salomonis]|uniref:F0F1 ATP synthase subunit B family protein n=1 Tax=Helicobacter salomonis TaxID=56878 RepID=UPI000CF18BAB|nr:hypothetical protein [Helicobacter salomonis]